MAAAGNSGGHSPTSSSRNEKIFEEAQHTGCINLSGRKLKEFPHCANGYDLSDTVTADLSKNRFVELPRGVCKYESLEQLSCYHNAIKVLPDALIQLQALVHLNLGRNQLTMLPAVLCNLPSLEVLLAANNKLVSLPEEIGKLEKLMELDVSCNEITQLPSQVGDLQALKSLNVRRNLLLELPSSLSRLKLHRLDFSCNKVSEIPCDMHSMDTLQEMRMEHNPLVCPPSHLCTKGLVHIKKFLFIQALKENRKRGHMTDVTLRKGYNRKSGLVNNFRHTEDFRHNGIRENGHKRHTVDSGYSTTDSSEKMRWSPSEVNNDDAEEANNLALRAAESVKEQRQERELQRRILHDSSNHSNHNGPVQTSSTATATQPPPMTTNNTPTTPLATVTTPPVSRETAATGPPPLHLHIQHQGLAEYLPHQSPVAKEAQAVGMATSTPPPPPMTSPPISTDSPKDSFSSTSSVVSGGTPGDQFTRELQRQKSDYEARKKRAELLRLERERERDHQQDESAVEREERRKAVRRIQEEQKAVLERQREEARRKADRESVGSSMAESLSSTSLSTASSVSDHETTNTNSRQNRIPQSNSFREEKNKANHAPYRRTVSDTNYNNRYPYNHVSGSSTSSSPNPDRHGPELSPSVEEETRRRSNVRVERSPQAEPSPVSPDNPHQGAPRVHYIPVIHDTSPQQQTQPLVDEFRQRHEMMINHQRREAQMLERRLEEQKKTILRMDMVVKWSAPHPPTTKFEDREEHPPYSPDSNHGNPSPNASFNGSAVPNHKSVLPPRCQKVLESLGPELNSMNPAFTIRRNLQHAQEEIAQIENLRRIIESRLKVTLPENLPAALKDGVVLCHLANHIRPRSVSSIHVPSPAVPKLPLAKCRRNVENFLEACRRIGVEQDNLFVPLDVVEERGILDVAHTVNILVGRMRETPQSAV